MSWHRCWTAGLLCLALPAGAQTWTLERSVLAGGGELYAESPDGRWKLSGTVGQAEPAADPARGAGWALRGGFWSAAAEAPTPRLFADGFETNGKGQSWASTAQPSAFGPQRGSPSRLDHERREHTDRQQAGSYTRPSAN